MVGRLIQTAKLAYQYPLIFKQLWHTPRVQAQGQEIVYRDLKRFTYLQIRDRIGRLASALSKTGVVPDDTVGVLDWDSNRFFEAFFAIPMMGAVLQGAMRDEHASLAKAFCTVKCRETVGYARELLGGNGILLENHIGRFVADAEAIYSYEGTREMNTLIVGKSITGLSAFV
jgi:alkylation response protein AidB-like acyl-CoA dehydrogenase